MDVEVRFFFYLASTICLVLAALGQGWRFGGRGRRGLAPQLVLLPLGLALWLFPTLWDTAVAAF